MREKKQTPLRVYVIEKKDVPKKAIDLLAMVLAAEKAIEKR